MQVEVGGGGGSGGGGSTGSAQQGGTSTVALITAAGTVAGTFLQATGGGGGQYGYNASESGAVPGVGTAQSAAFLSDVQVRVGGGGSGGRPGTSTSSGSHGHSSNCGCSIQMSQPLFIGSTGAPGANGGFVSATIKLTSGQQLQACAGAGGAGGSQRGNSGFVIVRGYF